MSSERVQRRIKIILVGVIVGLLPTLWMFQDYLACRTPCYIDFHAVGSSEWASLAQQDTRLNTWILAWGQRALLHSPLSLFDANAFYPASNSLTGSEHMLGLAIPSLLVAWHPWDPVNLYRLAVLFSSVSVGFTTFLFSRELSGNLVAAAIAGIVAVVMPWRHAELAHLQLFAAHWIPLVWLLFGRSISGKASGMGRVVLGVVLTLQVLTSFYIAYLVTLSLAVVGIVFLVSRSVTWRGVAATSVPVVLAYASFGITALPYLQRAAKADLQGAMGVTAITPTELLAMVVPPVLLAETQLSETAGQYGIPALVVVCAVVLFVVLIRMRSNVPGYQYLWSLIAIVAVSFVLGLGQELVIGETVFRLPGGFAAQWIPGYDRVRAPQRWAILISLAIVPMASVVWAWLLRTDGRGLVRLAIAVGVLFLATFPSKLTAVVPVAEAWNSDFRALYSELARLPPGPTLSWPWHDQSTANQQADSEYMVLSSLHWNPTLNGFTAYPPASYFYLRDLVQGLPYQIASFEALVRFTGLRWLVVHERSSPAFADGWTELERRSLIKKVGSSGDTVLYEVESRPDAGQWLYAFREQGRRPTTVTGLSRSGQFEEARGELFVTLPKMLTEWNGQGVPFSAYYMLRNRGPSAWPALDPDPEGLFELSARFTDTVSGEEFVSTAAFHRDVESGAQVEGLVRLTPPGRAGEYNVETRLVQLRNGVAEPTRVVAPPWVLSVAPM